MLLNPLFLSVLKRFLGSYFGAENWAKSPMDISLPSVGRGHPTASLALNVNRLPCQFFHELLVLITDLRSATFIICILQIRKLRHRES